MKFKSRDRILLVLAGILLAAGGCANRGVFTQAACKDDGTEMGRRAIPAGAAAAIYVDKDGIPLGDRAEDLYGTKDDTMCPTPPAGGPGGCSPKPPWCTVKVNGVNYCVRC
jgi:hypothetical protein